MRKHLKRLAALAVILVLLLGIRYAWQAFPIVSGYGAKNMCSCTFISGRDKQSILDNELGGLPLSIGTFDVNLQDSIATASVFGLAKRTAVFRSGLGCVIVNGKSISELKEQRYTRKVLNMDLDTIPWPNGYLISDTVLAGIDISAVNAIVEKAFNESADSKKNTRGVVVLFDGFLVAEKYGEEFGPKTPQIGWSMTKSVTSTLVGILRKYNTLDISAPAPVGAWNNGEDPRAEITLDQLLRMSSGLEWVEDYGSPGDATNMLFRSDDMGEFAASLPQKYAGDSVWYYSSGTSNIISKIVRQTIGAPYLGFAEHELFAKLGIESAIIETDANGTYVGSSYMWATPRDWAKLGLLYYQDGIWGGARILPEGWVQYSKTPTAKSDGAFGAHFWLNAGNAENPTRWYYPNLPADMYSMNGFEGQRVFIIPSKKLVVVRMGQTAYGNFNFSEFLEELVATVQ